MCLVVNAESVNQSTAFPRQPRAFLCPLSSTYPPAPIYYRRFTIGTGAIVCCASGTNKTFSRIMVGMS